MRIEVAYPLCRVPAPAPGPFPFMSLSSIKAVSQNHHILYEASWVDRLSLYSWSTPTSIVFARIRETGLHCNVFIPFTGEILPACYLLPTVSFTQYTGEFKRLRGYGNLALPESRSSTAFDDQRPLERNVINLSVYVSGDVQSHQTMTLFKSPQRWWCWSAHSSDTTGHGPRRDAVGCIATTWSLIWAARRLFIEGVPCYSCASPPRPVTLSIDSKST